jgi:hypothetical protein
MQFKGVQSLSLAADSAVISHPWPNKTGAVTDTEVDYSLCEESTRLQSTFAPARLQATSASADAQSGKGAHGGDVVREEALRRKTAWPR